MPIEPDLHMHREPDLHGGAAHWSYCTFFSTMLFFLFEVLGIEPRRSLMLGKCSITGLQPPYFKIFVFKHSLSKLSTLASKLWSSSLSPLSSWDYSCVPACSDCVFFFLPNVPRFYHPFVSRTSFYGRSASHTLSWVLHLTMSLFPCHSWGIISSAMEFSIWWVCFFQHLKNVMPGSPRLGVFWWETCSHLHCPLPANTKMSVLAAFSFFLCFQSWEIWLSLSQHGFLSIFPIWGSVQFLQVFRFIIFCPITDNLSHYFSFLEQQHQT